MSKENKILTVVIFSAFIWLGLFAYGEGQASQRELFKESCLEVTRVSDRDLIGYAQDIEKCLVKMNIVQMEGK